MAGFRRSIHRTAYGHRVYFPVKPDAGLIVFRPHDFAAQLTDIVQRKSRDLTRLQREIAFYQHPIARDITDDGFADAVSLDIADHGEQPCGVVTALVDSG